MDFILKLSTVSGPAILLRKGLTRPAPGIKEKVNTLFRLNLES